jgi:hypothetical protein
MSSENNIWQGVWTSNTEYAVNATLLFNNEVYTCIISHTSTAEFDLQKWQKLTGTVSLKGAWKTDTDYAVNDMITEDGKLYLSKVTHRSNSNNFLNDLGNWELIASGPPRIN